ncbi:MAG: UV DNA damage repair endonuclease UvsE [Clostridiales bacterium]
MNIGYACKTHTLADYIKSCRLKNSINSVLNEITSHNIQTLDKMIDYNIKNNINLFRISSDIIPFASNNVNKQLWWDDFKDDLSKIGSKLKESGIRVSMNPGQYTVLNSPITSVVSNAINELNYHAKFLDSLGIDKTNKIILHIGGVYNDKELSITRFIQNYNILSQPVKNRLVIENDIKNYNVEDILRISKELRIPAIFNNMNNKINSTDSNLSEVDWIKKFAQTWSPSDGKQKIKYSQRSKTKKKIGIHSDTIYISEFMKFYNSINSLDLDIILEVKDKNLSAIKCINTANNLKGKYIEREWARYKYKVLEKSQKEYKIISNYLNNQDELDVVEFYKKIENVIFNNTTNNEFINSSQHVWGYFKDIAITAEKNKFEKLINSFKNHTIKELYIRNFLYRLARKYNIEYLLDSYYFVDI